MRLVFRGPLGAGSFDLGEHPRVSIGRGPTCDLVLSDDRASRIHAVIERIDAQHLVKDAGSSNGTFLNGLRMNGAAFALRDKDVLEIGSTRLVYSETDADDALVPAPPASSVITQATIPIDELAREGYARIETSAAGDLSIAVAQSFQGAPPRAALRRATQVLATRLAFSHVGLWLRTPPSRLHLVTGFPTPESVVNLEPDAKRAFESGEARIASGVLSPGGASALETVSEGLVSSGSVPLRARGMNVGALVVERVRGKRIDRADLALLAVIGERIVKELVEVEMKNPNDTSIGAIALSG